MKSIRQWIVPLVVLFSLVSVGTVLALQDFHIYLPVVIVEATLTPTATSTPTQTPTVTATVGAPTPTATHTPNDVYIAEINQRVAGNVLGENVVITNGTNSSRTLTNWTLRDEQTASVDASIFTFPTFTLGAKDSVTIYTGEGTNTSDELYWGRTEEDGPVWNDGSDCAYLRDNDGDPVDTVCYGTLNLNAP